MYIEKKKIGKNTYTYARISVRVGNKVKTKTLAYLGSGTMTKEEIEKRSREISKQRIENAKLSLREKRAQILTQEELEEIDNIKKDFANRLRRMDSQLIQDMLRDFKTSYIYNTNAMEGNTLTLEETNMLLNDGLTPSGKDLREIYDHINEKETFDYIWKEKPNLTKETIIDIHTRLLRNIDKRSGFRAHNVRIVGAELDTTDARYVSQDMSLLLSWYNKNTKYENPLTIAAIFHEKFERIHPFYDGNGRTGRMIINLILARNNLPPLIIKNKERKEYYRVLDIGHKAPFTDIDQSHYRPIVEFCLKNFMETYKSIFSKWG